MKPNIELYIEDPVLHGFARSDRYHIVVAAKRELSRLFAERSMPPSLSQRRRAARRDGGAFTVQPGSTADVTGARVARAVYGGLG